MKTRYLVAIKHSQSSPIDAEALSRSIGLDLAFDRFPILGYADAPDHRLIIRDRGIILGTLFWRNGPPCPIGGFEEGEAATILGDAGQSLLTRCWGGYVSVLRKGQSARVLRDPSGILACYYAETPTATLFASDVDLLLATGLVSSRIDWPEVGRHHLFKGLPRPATMLDGICELLPGCALDTPAQGNGQHPCWSPWDYAHPEREQPSEPAGERLRRIVAHSTSAWTSCHTRLLVSVSGGLDSSIIASCLARSGRDVRCITMYTDDPAGDEREYARALCQHLGLPLVECRYQIEDVDIDAPVSLHLPRSIGRTLNQAYERAHLRIARSLGIDAFVTGSGGDNVFAYSQSAAAIADRWLSEGLSSGVLRSLRDVCLQTGCGPIEAVQAAMRSRTRRGYVWRVSRDFLHPDLCAAADDAGDHPWLDAPPAALPGKAAHIAGLLRVQPLLEPSRGAFAPVLYPLISQPVIETCLAIPTWEWRSGGRDRAVARDAFEAQLPESILRRRVKGGPDGFSAAILRYHRKEIRGRLLDGHLAQQGIVDRTALDARLSGNRPLDAAEQVQVLDLLDTEAWVGAWTRRFASLSSPVPRSDVVAESPSA